MSNNLETLVAAVDEEIEELKRAVSTQASATAKWRASARALEDENKALKNQNRELLQQARVINLVLRNDDVNGVERKTLVIGSALALLCRADEELGCHNNNAYCELDIIDDTLMEDIKVCKEDLVAAGFMKDTAG